MNRKECLLRSLVPLDRVVMVSRIIWSSLRFCSTLSKFLVDFIVFTFRGTSFSLHGRPVHPSFFLSIRIYFLLLFLRKNAPTLCCTDAPPILLFVSTPPSPLCFVQANRIMESANLFSPMNLREQLYKKNEKKNVARSIAKAGLSRRYT